MKPQDNEGGFDILAQLHGVVKPSVPTVVTEAPPPEEDPTITVIKEDPQWLSITNDLLFH